MDIVMLGMDGLTATRRIKAKFQDARILVITQDDNSKLRDSAREAKLCGATQLVLRKAEQFRRRPDIKACR